MKGNMGRFTLDVKMKGLILGLAFALYIQICASNEFHHLDDVSFDEEDHPHDKCTRRRMDVIFILDESSSIPPATFRSEKRFVAKMLRQFDIGLDATRVGILTFADNTRVHTNLRNTGRRHEIWSKVKKIRQFGGNTDTGEALRILRTYSFHPAQGARIGTDVPQICIVVTDGGSQRHDLTKIQALRAKSKGFIMFSVGVGPQSDEVELRNIASNIHYILTHEDHEHAAGVTCEASAPPLLSIIPGCADTPVDLVFILDNSNSIPHSSYDKMMEFVADVVMGFKIGKDDTRVALVKFASNAYLEFNFNAYFDREDASDAVRSTSRVRGGTYTYFALKLVEDEILTVEHGARPGVPKVAIVITDGNSATRRHTIWEAGVLRRKGVRFFAIGVGQNIDQSELVGIVGEENPNDVFMAESFDLLIEFRETMVLHTCGDAPTRAPATTPRPIDIQPGCEGKKADVMFVIDSSTSVAQDDYEKMMKFVSYYVQSMDIGDDTRVGVIMYASTARVPMELGYYNSRGRAGRAVENLRRLRGSTDTAGAIKLLHQMIDKMRDDALRIGIIMTDGESNDGELTLKEAEHARDMGILLFSLGIGSEADQTELAGIVDNKRSLVYSAEDFDSLSGIANSMVRATCRANPLPPKPTAPPRFIYDACRGKELDVFFIIDSSNGIRSKDWPKLLKFVEGMAWGFDVSRSNTHVALITYARTAKVTFGLNRHYTRQDATAAILGASRMSERGADAGAALRLMRQYSQPNYGGRDGAVKVGIFVTAGSSDDPDAVVAEAKTTRDDLGFILFAIGVGEYNFDELEGIVDVPYSESRLFTVNKVDDLPEHEEVVVTTSCKATKAVKKYDITITRDFAPRRNNPIAVVDREARLLFDLKLANVDTTKIPGLSRGKKNYAVDFYFSQADLSRTSISRTNVYKLQNVVEPGLEFELIGNGPASRLITFTTTGNLPSRQCNKYVWFCACVKEGRDAAFTDSDTSNNCRCRPADDLISCSPDITVRRFNPNWRGITFKKEEAVNLRDFNIFIKNAARKEPGNDIYKAIGGDNYALDLYFAYEDLTKNPRAMKSEAFPATVTTGDLSVALAALDQTSELYARALVTLPLRNCERFVWLCACVREGSAAKYADANKNNNCECKDVSPQTMCKDPDPDLSIDRFTVARRNKIFRKERSSNLDFDVSLIDLDGGNIPKVARRKNNYALDFYVSQDNLERVRLTDTTAFLLKNIRDPSLDFGLIAKGAASTALSFVTSGKLPSERCNKYVWFCACVREGRDAQYKDADTTNNCKCQDARMLISCSPDITVTNFDPKENEYFRGEEVEIDGFTINVKNAARKSPGNDIFKAPSDDNFAIQMHFAKADLAVNPRADKTPPFPAALKTGDLSVALDATKMTRTQTMKAKVFLPDEDSCNEFMWLCACVKEGPGAEYEDANPNNNCECKDVSPFMKCIFLPLIPIDGACFGKKADVTFIVDSSDGMSNSDFEALLTYVQSLAMSLDVSKDNTHVALIITANQAAISFDLSSYPDREATAFAIVQAKRQKGRRTNLAEAILMMKEINRVGGHGGALKVGVVVTTQLSADPQRTKAEAKAARDEGYIMFAIGVKNSDFDELEGIADIPYSETRLFMTSRVSRLPRYKDPVISELCNAKLPVKMPDLVMNDFTVSDRSPVIRMGKDTSVDLEVIINNKDGSDIVNVARWKKNYALDFYLSRYRIGETPVDKARAQLLKTIKEPALDFGLVAKGAASSILKFLASTRLPVVACNDYVWLCACVREGSDAQYTDADGTNNCKCQDIKLKISCNPDIMVSNFDPNTDKKFSKGAEVELSDFVAKVKNGAPRLPGNNIYKTVSGDNYALHLHFAQDDLARNPSAKKSPPFAATLKTGDLSVALAAGFATLSQRLRSMITLPAEECPAYTWLCACVREGRGAQYNDSNPNNNCECKDVTSQIECEDTAAACVGKPVDVVFIIDNSNSIRNDDYVKMIDFVETLIGSFDVSPSAAQIGMVTYASDTEVRFELNKYTDSATIIDFVDKMRRQHGGTQTGDALQEAREHTFQPEHGARAGIPQIAIVITDGVSANRRQTVSEAQITRDHGIRIYAIGIGPGVDVKELEGIAGSANPEQVFSAQTFEALETLNEKIVQDTCTATVVKTPACKGKPSDVVFIIDNSNSIRNDDYVKMMDFVETLIGSFDVRQVMTRIGMVTYASESTVRFELNKFENAPMIIDFLSKMRRQHGGTQTGDALAEAREHTFHEEHGARKSVDQIAIVITDGVSANRRQTLAEALLVRNEGIKVFAVGIGPGIDKSELQGIAGNEFPDRVFSAESFEHLQVLNEKIVAETCSEEEEKFFMFADAPMADAPMADTTWLHVFADDKPEPLPCNEKASDVVFMLDCSATVSKKEYNQMINFVKSVIRDKEFNVGGGHNTTRVSVVLFANSARVEIFLDDNWDLPEYMRAIHRMRRIYGRTNIAEALRTVRASALSPFRGGRPDVGKFVVLVTDGRTANRARSEEEAALNIIEGIETLAIGVGKRVSTDELNAIVGTANRDNIYNVADFSKLHKVKDDVVKARCKRG